MAKVKIDGVDYSIDEPASQAVLKLQAHADSLAEQLDAAKKQAAEQQARADKAAEDLEAEQKARADDASADKVQAAVKARVALETLAAKVIADDTVKLDEMSDDDIRKAVVLKVSPKAEAKLDSADAAYLSARFDAAVDAWQAAQDAKPKASDSVRAATGGNVRQDAASARQRMIEANLKMGQAPIRPTSQND